MKAPRPGLIASSVAHAAILAYAIVGFASKPFQVDPIESMPIDIVTPQEYDALTKGAKTSKVVVPPKLQATKVAEAPPEPKEEALPEAKEDVVPPPPTPRPAPKLAEEPKPEPPKPAPKVAEQKPEPPKPQPPKPEPPKLAAVPTPAPRPPEAKPEPPKPEQKLAELPKPQPKPEPPKPEQKVAEQPKPPPPKRQPKPDPIAAQIDKTKDVKPDPRKVETAKAAPRTPDQKAPDRKFDISKISALLDRREPTRTASLGPQLASASTAGLPSGNAPKLALSERRVIDGIVSDQVRPRWSPPIGALGATDLQVRVRFTLNQDGSLVGLPTIVNRGSNPFFQAAADAAVRAVRMAAPLKNLPVQSYDYWREVEITFDPRDMAGG